MHWTALAWPLGTFLLTALFKPRTPEQFDAMLEAGWPRFVVNLVRFVAAVGVDGSAMSDILRDLAHKTSRTATEEYVAKLPADIRATLPPLSAPPRIDSREMHAVKDTSKVIRPGDYLFNDLDLPK